MYYVPEHCFMATRTILGLVGPFWPLLKISGPFRRFWCCLGNFGAPVDPQMAPWVGQYDIQSCIMSLNTVLGSSEPFQGLVGTFSPLLLILGRFGAVLGHFGAPVGTRMAPVWSNMTYNQVVYPWEVF